MKNSVNKILRYFNLELKSTKHITNWLDEKEFHLLYDKAQQKTQMLDTDNEHRRQRHFMLLQFLHLLGKPKNAVVECGSWRGLSSYQICHYLNKYYQESPSTVKYHIFDSFEGLSDLSKEDIPVVSHVTPGKKGILNCSLDVVSENLKEFPFITYHKGWIPTKFHQVEDEKFSFVHIDVDLYQPIVDAIEFFYPRLETGGMMIFDDYAYLQFPGALKAVEEFVEKTKCRRLKLTTGQAVIFKD